MKNKQEPKERKLSAMAVDCRLDQTVPTNDVEAIELFSNSSQRNRGIDHAKKLFSKTLYAAFICCCVFRCLHVCCCVLRCLQFVVSQPICLLLRPKMPAICCVQANWLSSQCPKPIDCRVSSLENSTKHHHKVCPKANKKKSVTPKSAKAVQLDVPTVPPNDQSPTNANISRLT